MTDGRSRDDRPADIDWQSPRWRDAEEDQGESEREHRFRDAPSRPERGAIDRGGSVGDRSKPELPADREQE